MIETSIIFAVKKLRFLLSSEEKKRWLGIAAFAICISLLEVMAASSVVLFAEVLNQSEINKSSFLFANLTKNWSYQHMVLITALLCATLFVIKNVMAGIEAFFQNYSIQRINYGFKEKILKKYANINYSFYLTRNTSFGSAVVGGDVEQVFSTGMAALANVFSESIVFIFLIIMISIINPPLFLIVVCIGLVLAYCINKWCLPLFYKWGKLLQDTRVQSGQHLYQFFQGYKEIILLNKRDAFISAYLRHAINTTKTQAFLTATNFIPRLAIEVLFMGVFVLAVAYLCFRHQSPQQLMGILAGYLYVGFRLMPGLNRIIAQLNSFKSIIPSINRVYEESMLTQGVNHCLDIPGFQFNHSINLEKCTYSYPNSERESLQEVSLIIKKGECVGVIGETGSGKSTLIDMILGLLIPQQGNIAIDGKYSPACQQWHLRIGYVPQSIYLIDDTISANIVFGELEHEIDHERLLRAVNDAQLTEFIQQLPQGIMTVVGERGIRLSGGERQRIAIARALYRNPEVLIFDEATSALDIKTEERLMETIQRVSKNRTVIMIAHRYSTLKECDRIIQMQEGKIKEYFEYSDLLQSEMKPESAISENLKNVNELSGG